MMSDNPLPRASSKIQLLGRLLLVLILYFACSPQKWVITTTWTHILPLPLLPLTLHCLLHTPTLQPTLTLICWHQLPFIQHLHVYWPPRQLKWTRSPDQPSTSITSVDLTVLFTETELATSTLTVWCVNRKAKKSLSSLTLPHWLPYKVSAP